MIMKTKNSTLKIAIACIAIGWMCWSVGNFCNAQTPPANPSGLSPDLQEVMTLSRQQMGEDVITNYIKSTGKSYKLSADDIIYLKNQGISQGVISALLQTASSSGSPADQNPNLANPSMPSPAPAPTTSPAPVETAPPPAPSNLVQEYDDYVFELKECKLEDREDKQLNDGKPHKQLVCKVLVTNKTGDRILSMCFENNGGETRTIDDMGTEYDCGGGTLGISSIRWIYGGIDNAKLVVPSGVPVKAVLLFGVIHDRGIGFFSPEAKSLGVLDIGFISDDTEGRKPFHIQFKNVPIPLVEAPPPPVATAAPTPMPTPAPVVAPVPAPGAAPAPEVNFTYFHDQLAPFGTWLEVPGYGQCWYPEKVIAGNPDWRPYYDNGKWVQTDNGLFWQSDYTWGDIPFHYGRWIRDPRYGWLWVPDYTWGPAWVCWRQAEADGCIGWAPLPFGAVWVDGGWRFHDRAVVEAGYDFGLGEDFFVFVGNDHFHEAFPHRLKGHESEYVFNIDRARVHEFYGRTVIRNEFRKDEHGRLINDGIGRERLDRIAQVTHHPIEKVSFEERHPVGDRDQLAAPRPPVARPGEKPPIPASVNKAFRPPVPAPKPVKAPPQDRGRSSSERPNGNFNG
jgi:hypothetical protein